VSVIPYGIDLGQFDPASHPRAQRPSDARLVVGTMSRLSPEKGLEYLLRATALLRDRGTDVDVVVAGEGPSRDELKALATALKLDERVTFPGEVRHEDVPGVLAGLDIFAMPSTWEGFGVSALEASAMKLPVVASDIHGIPDVVIDGETGLLVPPADPAALADAIERLARDEGLRKRMGEAGRAYVAREYRWEDNARLMEALYDEMTASFEAAVSRAHHK
jgi:glycosyltransferase involved in cell wall biosynthesis